MVLSVLKLKDDGADDVCIPDPKPVFEVVTGVGLKNGLGCSACVFGGTKPNSGFDVLDAGVFPARLFVVATLF